MKNKFQTPTILAVDDTPGNLQVIGELLMKWEYKTVLAQSTSECLEYLNKNTPNLILMDNECSIYQLLRIADDRMYKQKNKKEKPAAHSST